MKILDYIFKNREQREKEAKEAEEKKDLKLSLKADKLYKEKKYDECLKVCMELVNKDFCGLGFWSVYLFAAEILYEKKRYKDILEVSKHYKRFYDRDSDRHMDWYESMARRAIEEQKHLRPAPKPQSKTISTPAPRPVSSPQPVAKPVPKPIAPDPPKPEVHVPKWDDNEMDEPESKKTSLPRIRQIVFLDKVDTLYWKYLQARKSLPPYDMLGTPTYLPKDAVEAIMRIKAEAQDMLDRADALMRQGDISSAAYLYERLIANQYWEPAPYYALIKIYECFDRKEDAQDVRKQGIYNMNNIQRQMRNEFLAAARRIDAEDLALDMIKKGEKVVYGIGLYTVYDPFPCIKLWERQLVGE